MTSNSPSQFYSHLTPRERLALIIAAARRGDEVEKKRLAASAPIITFEGPDYLAPAEDFCEIADLHLITLLDLGMHLWRWWGLCLIGNLRNQAADSPPKGRRGKPKAANEQQRRAGSLMRYYAARFVAHVDGWKQFCAEVHIEPEALLHFMIGWDNVVQTESKARELAFTSEDAAWFVRLETVPVNGDESRQEGPEPVETAAEVCAGWHDIWAKLIEGSL